MIAHSNKNTLFRVYNPAITGFPAFSYCLQIALRIRGLVCGYEAWFTGMKLLKHDGSQLYLKGFEPDYFAPFNRFTNFPLACYNGELYNLPFNMNTFTRLWNVKNPAEARLKIEKQRAKYDKIYPANLEEQALKMCGNDIYLFINTSSKDIRKSNGASLQPNCLRQSSNGFLFDLILSNSINWDLGM